MQGRFIKGRFDKIIGKPAAFNEGNFLIL